MASKTIYWCAIIWCALVLFQNNKKCVFEKQGKRKIRPIVRDERTSNLTGLESITGIDRNYVKGC